jgi:hypothetical protein
VNQAVLVEVELLEYVESVGVGFVEVAMVVEAHDVLDEDSMLANSVGR